MIDHHIKPNERTRFARTTREAFGMGMPYRERTRLGDRFVFILCALSAAALIALGVMP